MRPRIPVHVHEDRHDIGTFVKYVDQIRPLGNLPHLRLASEQSPAHLDCGFLRIDVCACAVTKGQQAIVFETLTDLAQGFEKVILLGLDNLVSIAARQAATGAVAVQRKYCLLIPAGASTNKEHTALFCHVFPHF